MSSILAFTRVRIAVVAAAFIIVAGVSGCANTAPPAAANHDTAIVLPETPIGTTRDFDFEHGRWHTSLRRLVKPLSGSTEWAEYTGTTIVTALLGGRANIVELDVTGPQGRIEAMSLRLFDTQRKKWTLNFSSAASGTLEVPMSGGFASGKRGVFYSNEDFRGKPIVVRFVIEMIDADTCRFEQAFSGDGGKTWEVNWVAVDTRIKI